MSARSTTVEKLRPRGEIYTHSSVRVYLLARKSCPVPRLKHFLQGTSSDLFEHLFILLVHESRGDGPLAQAHLIHFTQVKRSTKQHNKWVRGKKTPHVVCPLLARTIWVQKRDARKTINAGVPPHRTLCVVYERRFQQLLTPFTHYPSVVLPLKDRHEQKLTE